MHLSLSTTPFLMAKLRAGEVPERSNGTDLKSVVAFNATVGSNPTLSATLR